MFGLCEYLLSHAQHLDSQGRFASADVIDRLAQSTLDEQYPVLYHGTKQDYEPADVQVDQSMQGLYMTTSKDDAGKYGDVRSYKLRPDVNILDLSDGEELWGWMTEHEILDEEDVENEDLHNYVINGQVYQYDLSSRTHYADEIVRTARALGYDVIKMPDYPLGDDHTAWVVTHKDAIQSERSSQRVASLYSMDNRDGEYWIQDNGDAVYADGDFGDYNHAMLAEQEILNRLGYDSYEYDNEDVASLDDANNQFDNALKNAKSWKLDDSALGEYFAMLVEKHGEDDWKDWAELEDYLFWKEHSHITDEDELSKNKQEFDKTWAGLKDPVLHATQNFGWYRVKPSGNIPGVAVETWTLTPQDASTIARGLEDAYEEYVDSQRYNIEVRSTGEYFTGVPFEEIASGAVVNRLKNRPSNTPMQQGLDTVDLSNQLSVHAPVSDSRYQHSLETNYPGPDNDKIRELYRYQGAANRASRSLYSWYASENALPSAFCE